ncbi:MAG: NfeD family protein [Cetobacterium sp.]|uniref:NfeD family protein n=1 Tax=Cetobacterium sp. TaxID=2071632 RepID=UPI003F30A493
MWFWFFLGLIFLGVELLNYGLFSIWFAIGAFVTMGFTGFSPWIQFYVFVLVSLITLLLIRRIAVKYLRKKSKVLDRITGKMVSIQGIEDKGYIKVYTVYLDGKYWSAISEEQLEIGDDAMVEKVEGNRLILKYKKGGNL